MYVIAAYWVGNGAFPRRILKLGSVSKNSTRHVVYVGVWSNKALGLPFGRTGTDRIRPGNFPPRSVSDL